MEIYNIYFEPAKQNEVEIELNKIKNTVRWYLTVVSRSESTSAQRTEALKKLEKICQY